MEKATVGMTVRRSGARLRAMAKAHGPLHVLLWQARETQSTLLAAASAQKTLFNDIAAWASTENRALSDVCSCASELSSLYTSALAQLALAYKSFRKEMSLVLEGERRCDAVQRKLHEAESKRVKLRRQVLRAQNRMQTNGEPRRSGDFTALQTQLAEAERTAERSHMEACEASREQEAVKLVVVKSALNKLSDSHLKLASQSKIIYEGSRELTVEVPDPPPPGDPLSCIRYTGYDHTKGVVDRVKNQVHLGAVSIGFGSTPGSSRPVSTSTPLTSPNSSIWTPEPTAPHDLYSQHEPPPPYNISFLSPSHNNRSTASQYLNQSSFNMEIECRQNHRRSLYQNASVSPTSSNSLSYNLSNASIHDRSVNNGEASPGFHGSPNLPPSPSRSDRY